MNDLLSITGDLVMAVSVVCVLVWAPFTHSWSRAFWIVVIPVSAWAAIRLFCIAAYSEASPPMIGFVVAPVGALVYALLLRLLRIAVQKVYKKLRR